MTPIALTATLCKNDGALRALDGKTLLDRGVSEIPGTVRERFFSFSRFLWGPWTTAIHGTLFHRKQGCGGRVQKARPGSLCTGSRDQGGSQLGFPACNGMQKRLPWVLAPNTSGCSTIRTRMRSGIRVPPVRLSLGLLQVPQEHSHPDGVGRAPSTTLGSGFRVQRLSLSRPPSTSNSLGAYVPRHRCCRPPSSLP